MLDSSSAEADDRSRRVLFHVAFLGGLARGNRVTYLGQHFNVLEISDSKRLVGLELICEPASEGSASTAYGRGVAVRGALRSTGAIRLLGQLIPRSDR